MRTRIVTCATPEGGCIWYSEIDSLLALYQGKLGRFSFGGGVVGMPTWEVGQKAQEGFLETSLCSIF